MSELILIIEDDADLAQVLEEVIESFGYRARRAGTADQALACLAGEPPALAIVDWSVLDEPERAGRAFREAGVPMVLASGWDASSERARQLGAIEVLKKPYSVEELLEVLERALTRSGARRPGAEPPP